ncbi:hypothetical protein IGI04_011482 [Brassica rapa subsp. trilocularis]|uniref:Uncharacterized protein n=1 Tax=Brassica rapa subsp. trilocularis TaxID=1813537 RepID=A0ABQ7N370_BRACM|nr:hypothetical protein IGI04_011482 [Brassica rapa subsp. trilocularis]
MSYNDPLHLISIQSFSQLEQISSNHQVIKNVFLYCYVAQAVHHSLRLGHTSPFDCCSPPRFWDSHNGRKIVKLRESTSSSCSWTRRYSYLHEVHGYLKRRREGFVYLRHGSCSYFSDEFIVPDSGKASNAAASMMRVLRVMIVLQLPEENETMRQG